MRICTGESHDMQMLARGRILFQDANLPVDLRIKRLKDHDSE
jgi:hypothetical protein